MKTNYAAVFIGAVAYWLLGAVWYGVLFRKPWMALENISIEQAKSMNPVLPYVITFVLNLLIAYALAQICIWRNANTVGRGASVGVLLWIGFIGPSPTPPTCTKCAPKNSSQSTNSSPSPAWS